MALTYCGVHKWDWYCKRLTGCYLLRLGISMSCYKMVIKGKGICWRPPGILALVSLRSCHGVWIVKSKRAHLARWGCCLLGFGNEGVSKIVAVVLQHHLENWELDLMKKSMQPAQGCFSKHWRLLLPCLSYMLDERSWREARLHIPIHSFVHSLIHLFPCSFIYSFNKNIFVYLRCQVLRKYCSYSEKEAKIKR